jgi:surfeit locus 1 family protein
LKREYDFSNQVVLINQAYHDQPGGRLFTPLHILNSDKVILVDRGWIPAKDAFSDSWRKYDEPGLVTVAGVIRLPQSKPDIGHLSDPTPIPGGERIKTWNLANISQMAQQMPYPLMGVYIQESPDPSWSRLPYRTEPELDLTEGSHMSYALQCSLLPCIIIVAYCVRAKHRSLKNNIIFAIETKTKIKS